MKDCRNRLGYGDHFVILRRRTQKRHRHKDQRPEQNESAPAVSRHRKRAGAGHDRSQGMLSSDCRIDGAAVGNFVGRYPKALIGVGSAGVVISWGHNLSRHCTARAQAGWYAQPYATAQSVCHLPIARLMKKNRNGESRMPSFFLRLFFPNKTFHQTVSEF